MSEILSESDITIDKLEAVFKAAFLACSRLEDGKVRIEEEGQKTLFRVDPERKLITIYSLWSMRQSAPDIKKLEWVNRLNNELVLVRFSMADPTTLVCDYQVRYEGGIVPHYLVSTYRLFARVCRGIFSQQGADQVMGSD